MNNVTSTPPTNNVTSLYKTLNPQSVYLFIANEPAERLEAAENSAARRMLYAEKFSNDL